MRCVCAGLLDAAWGVAMRRISVSFRVYQVEVHLVALGLHCLLRFSSAVLVVVLVPGFCWAYSAFFA